MRSLALLGLVSLVFLGSRCQTQEMTMTEPPSLGSREAVQPVVTAGMDNGSPYQLTMIPSCSNQSVEFAEIRERPDGQQGGVDAGIYFAESDESCEGVWSFDFVTGALLDNVDPDLGSRSFALIRQEGNEINIAALTVTTGWTIKSHEGGTRGEWLTLPAVKATTGDTVTITFTNAEQTKDITVTIDLTRPGIAVINQ